MQNLQLKSLHESSNGFFTIATNENHWKQFYYNNIENLDINIYQNNVYISQNTFDNRSRKLIHLKELKALYIDIDCYKQNISKDYAKLILEKDLYGQIPIPNMLIDSGRGLYYIIFLENTKADFLPKWQLVEQYLYSKMESIGADAKALDATRVLRVVGSFNPKSNSPVKIIDTYNYKYTLDDIIENYIPEVSEKKIQAKKKRKSSGNNKLVSLYNIYNLYYARYTDIIRLIELRNFKIEGKREITFFLIRYYLTVYADEEKALEEIIELNSMLQNPLTEKELINATRSASEKATERVYKYSNDKLIKLLEITPLEQKYLTTIISKEEKYYRNNKRRRENRRNEEGLTKKQQEEQILLEKVKELREKKYTINDIASKLNMSKRNVSILIKKLK